MEKGAYYPCEPEFIPEKKFMERALVLAKMALSGGDIPVGCVIEKDGVIIGEGYNTRERDKDPLGHAEVNAIKEASKNLGDWRLTGCRLYVTLEPCRMCSGASINARIERIIYGADDFAVSSCNQDDLDRHSPAHKIKVFPNFMEEECKKMLQSFFKDLRKNQTEN